jgi:hypothetical protein
VARPERGAGLTQQLLFEGELRIATTLEAVTGACELAGIAAPQLPPPLPASEQIVLLSVIQLRGVTLTQISRELSKSPALPIAWQLHHGALTAALEPLTRLRTCLRRFARLWPFFQWSAIGITLVIGAAIGIEQLQSALQKRVFTIALFGTATLVQYLLRRWLRRHFAAFVLKRLLGPDRS